MRYSHSSFTVYDACNAKYDYRYNKKVKMPQRPSPKRDRGTAIHETIEKYLSKKAEEVHEEVRQNYGQFFMALRELPGLEVEGEWGVTKEFTPTGFDSEDVAIRGKYDARLGDTTYEWKTGRVYPEHSFQRMLYGTAMLIRHPEYDSVTTITVYLDQQENKPQTWHRGMLPEYIGLWRRKMEEMEKQTMFIPKPQYLCVYCEYSRNSGGPCKF